MKKKPMVRKISLRPKPTKPGRGTGGKEIVPGGGGIPSGGGGIPSGGGGIPSGGGGIGSGGVGDGVADDLSGDNTGHNY